MSLLITGVQRQGVYSVVFHGVESMRRARDALNTGRVLVFRDIAFIPFIRSF
jgi:hypothetical protein